MCVYNRTTGGSCSARSECSTSCSRISALLRNDAIDNTLKHAATRCNTVQRPATLCSDPAVYSATLKCVSCCVTHCNTLQHTATHCNTLQHTPTNCNTLQHTTTRCNSLQHTATHCNTLQHTATHCNTLQHNVILQHTAT